MQYRVLTGTGITVSRLSLGTMTFGRETDEVTAVRMVHMALDAGINFVDEADAYAGTQSEVIVGKALAGRRDEVVLASKVANFSGKHRLRDAGLHRWHIINGVEESLRRLQTDHLDIYYWHKPDPNTPIEETLAAFDLLVQQGKVLYVGMSNHAAWQVCNALWKAQANRWAPPVVVQLPYNLISRAIDEECLAFCQQMRIGVVAYNPLAGGMLTGKYSREQAPTEGTRFGENAMYHQRFWHEANFTAVDRLREIASGQGKTLIELSLQWLMAQPLIDSLILGARTPEHLEQNIAAAEGTLSEDTLVACDEVWSGIRGPFFKYNR